MKILPRYVKKGDVISASDYNKQVRNVRDSGYTTPYGASVLAGIPNRKENPFSVIDFSVNRDGEDPRNVVKIKAGYIFQGTDAFQIYTSQTLTGDYVPIETIPEIVIPQQLINAGKGWLYVDLDKFELLWAGETEFDSRAIYVGRFEFNDDDGDLTDFKYVNLHPSNIQKTLNNYFIVTPWNQESTVLPESPAPDTCNITISNGYVINNDPKADSPDVLVKHRVKSNLEAPNGEYLDSEISPLWEGIEPDSVVYVRVQTDEKGVITDDEPEIVIGEEGQESVHYQPDPVATNGDYYYPIAKIKRLEFDGDDGDKYYQFVAEQMWDQNIFTQSDLPTLMNVGEKREVFKTYEAELNEYQFRTLEQLEGTGAVPIIKPLASGTEEGETIPFRYITQRASQEQIHVEETDDGNGVRVRGNNKDFDETDVRKFNIIVKDGLVTTLTKSALSGWWGQVGLQFAPKTGSFQTLTLDFEDGSLVDVACSQGVAGSGTENDPAVVLFQFGDT
jgi:hypothetical protein